jgi:glutamine synthetase
MGRQVNQGGGNSRNVVHREFRLSNVTETLAANKTLTVSSSTAQFLDPGGSARDVTLPAESDSDGLMFFISNEADGAEIISVKNDGGDTILTPTQNEACVVVCDGTSWSGMVGATS